MNEDLFYYPPQIVEHAVNEYFTFPVKCFAAFWMGFYLS